MFFLFFTQTNVQIYSAFSERVFEKYKKMDIYVFLYKNYAKRGVFTKKSNVCSKI